MCYNGNVAMVIMLRHVLFFNGNVAMITVVVHDNLSCDNFIIDAYSL